MSADLISLSIIALIAFAAPILTRLVPNKLVPETVLLLIAGALLGPYVANIIQVSHSVELLSELGLAFLFLLAGYEINPSNLTGSQGKRGAATWVVSFAIAFGLIYFLPLFENDYIQHIALTIAFTTTALGTLLPIMKERNILSTRVGDSILAYGTWGELLPILAMALLLSTRAELETILILIVFAVLCVLAAVVPAKARKTGHALFTFLHNNAETTSQTAMRAVVLLLVGLVTFSNLFELDIVLGSFAAGFVLRYIVPEGNDSLERKLDGIAYGFFIPIFFVISGANVNIAAVFARPELLIMFIVLLLLIRAVPIFVALSTGKDTRDISAHNRWTVALYCTTALPLIVAVTSVAVNAGALTQDTASVLVAAGAVTVFLMPLLASITYRIADAHPVTAVRKICKNPRDIACIVSDHVQMERLISRQEKLLRLQESGKIPHDFYGMRKLDNTLKEALFELENNQDSTSNSDSSSPSETEASSSRETSRHNMNSIHLAKQAIQEHRQRMNELRNLSESKHEDPSLSPKEHD